jgi:hypothetical protein
MRKLIADEKRKRPPTPETSDPRTRKSTSARGVFIDVYEIVCDR